MRFRALDLGLPDADGIAVVAMNSNGQIAGYTSTTSSEGVTFRCWLYNNGELKDLGSLGGQVCVPTAMNEWGQVVGHSTTVEGYEHPFIYSDGRMIDIGVLSGGSSPEDRGFAWAINSSGAVVGESRSATGETHTFLYEEGVSRDLDSNSLFSAGYGINDAGQITGIRSLPGGNPTAYRYDNGIFEDISAPGALSSVGRLINRAGDVAGVINTSTGQRAFLFTGDGLRELGTFGGPNSFPFAMNDRAQVVGSAFTSEGTFHAMLARDGELLDLGSLASPPNDASQARSINASGHVVGWTATPDGTTGFFSTGVGLHDLKALLTPDSAAGVTDPWFINDAEQIAATGLVNGRPHAFLLSPAAIATELAAAPLTVRFGSRPELSATLTSGSTPLAQKTVTFAIDGESVGSAITDDNGVAQLTATRQTTSTGDHSVSASFAGDGDYAASASGATLTVLKGHVRLIIAGGTFTYNGQPHRATVTATGALGETLTAGLVISYGDTANGSANAPVGAGTYSANVVFAGDDNYEPDTASAAITVLRAPLTVTAGDATKLLGAPNPAFAASYSGFISGETAAILAGTLAFATPGAATSPVGTYAIRPSGVSSPNYDIRYTDGTLTITYRVCVRFDQTKAARAGSTIPIKLDLCNASGIGASSPSVVLKTKTLRKLSGAASMDVQDSGDANPDLDFRYIGPGYIFNMKTTGLTTGTWDLVFTVTGDPLEHDVTFQVR